MSTSRPRMFTVAGARDAATFLLGLAIIVYEVFLQAEPRAIALGIAATLVGGPVALAVRRAGTAMASLPPNPAPGEDTDRG